MNPWDILKTSTLSCKPREKPRPYLVGSWVLITPDISLLIAPNMGLLITPNTCLLMTPIISLLIAYLRVQGAYKCRYHWGYTYREPPSTEHLD